MFGSKHAPSVLRQVLNLVVFQMLEHFNQEMGLGGKIASGHFCASFGLPIRYLQDLASMSFAYDGWFVKCYAIELERYHWELLDHVKEAVPSSWDPEAIARSGPGTGYFNTDIMKCNRCDRFFNNT